MTKLKVLVLLLLSVSIFCIVSLRPGDAVPSTVGRASIATAEKPLRLVDDEKRFVPASSTTTTTVAVPTTTTVPPTTVPPPPITTPPTISATVIEGDVWYRLAMCESSLGTGAPQWGINTGNGYYGGLQFSLGTWQSVGGTGYPHEHSAATQIEKGKILQARDGWGQWPACSIKLGLR